MTMRTLTDKEMLEYMLRWRGIEPGMDTVCNSQRGCGGSGVKMYGSTSTWMGGVGGQMMTQGVCDQCWGSGATSRPGVNLKKVRSDAEKAKAQP